MFQIRYAKPEEVEPIKDSLDLTPASTVVVAEDEAGKVTEIAVVRQALEIDPLIRGVSNSRFAGFFWVLRSHLKLSGANEVYFNAPVEDERWLQILDKIGAQRVSKGPEYRYKLYL